MFPLSTAAFPSSASDLERLLNESLQRIFVTESHPITIQDHSYPNLEAISISLDGARLRPDSPPPPAILGETSPALEIGRFALNAAPFLLGPAGVNLSLSARNVQLWQGKDAHDQIVLALHNVTGGHIDISATQSDLEAVVTKLAGDQASKQGITIDGVKLTMRQENAHSLAVEIQLRARKLFLSASLRVTGQLDLDDQLNLKISGLNCTGDGAVASLACGILKPYLEKIDGRVFPLMSLPLGEIRLRDVRLTVGDKLCITAEFGNGQGA